MSASGLAPARRSSISSWIRSICALGALLRDLLPQFRGDLLERPHGFRLDLRDPHQHRAEPAGDGSADRALLEGEGGVGDGRIEHLGLGEGAELEILRRHVALGCDGVEGRAVLDLGGGGLGLGLGREGDLLDRAALGRAVPRLLLLVALAGVGIGDGVGLGEGGWRREP